MEVVSDPKVLRVPVLGRDRVVVFGAVRREVGPVRLQERTADAPDHISEGPVFLRDDPLDQYAGVGGHRMNLQRVVELFDRMGD